MDRAGTPAEPGRPDAARVWRLCGFSGGTEIYVTGCKAKYTYRQTQPMRKYEGNSETL